TGHAIVAEGWFVFSIVVDCILLPHCGKCVGVQSRQRLYSPFISHFCRIQEQRIYDRVAEYACYKRPERLTIAIGKIFSATGEIVKRGEVVFPYSIAHPHRSMRVDISDREVFGE